MDEPHAPREPLRPFVPVSWLIIGTVFLAVAGIRLPGLEFRNQRVEAAYRKELVLGEDDADMRPTLYAPQEWELNGLTHARVLYLCGVTLRDYGLATQLCRLARTY